MLSFVLSYLTLSAICAPIVIYLMHIAAEGYEDETGFHLGPEPL